jgi:membrane protein required for colicin V production
VNWLDLCLLLVVAVSIVEGFWKGFARTATGFVAAGVAVLCGLWLYRPMGFRLRPYIDSKAAANAVGFLLVFGAIMILGAVAERLLAKFFKRAELTWLDRGLGGAFGVVRGLFGAAITVLLFMAFAPEPLSRPVVDSRLLPCLVRGARVMATAAPDEVRDGFRRAKRDLEAAPVPEPIRKGLAKLDPEM